MGTIGAIITGGLLVLCGVIFGCTAAQGGPPASRINHHTIESRMVDSGTIN